MVVILLIIKINLSRKVKIIKLLKEVTKTRKMRSLQALRSLISLQLKINQRLRLVRNLKRAPIKLVAALRRLTKVHLTKKLLGLRIVVI